MIGACLPGCPSVPAPRRGGSRRARAVRWRSLWTSGGRWEPGPRGSDADGCGAAERGGTGEPPQDAELHRAGQGARISGLESGGLVEADAALDVAGDHAIEGQHVVVIVRI